MGRHLLIRLCWRMIQNVQCSRCSLCLFYGLQDIVAACKGFAGSVVVEAPVAAATLAALKGGGDDEFGHFEHVYGFEPRYCKFLFVSACRSFCQDGVTQFMQLTPGFEQALLVAAEGDMLPHDLAQVAPGSQYAFLVDLNAQ